MSTPTETVQVAAVVSKELDDQLTEMARAAERSKAAEIRLALKAWTEQTRRAA